MAALEFAAPAWQGIGVAGLDIGNEAFAHTATQIPVAAGVGGADQARNCIARSLASVTCSRQTRPSHSSASLHKRLSSSRSASTGTQKSSHRNTVPISCAPVRVQFRKGFSMNQFNGKISRLSSQMRTTT
ncbi:hypothetical protein ACFPPA_11740 [Rhodanobacter ginsengisoli]|uniref:Uncharacterized protein n=1 Tax=Rhodanobacter ginsengisoli TaxID=418646 RepID=A0ABW0QUA5_9GAMM